MPAIPPEIPYERLPLGRCHCTWWRVAVKDYGKAKCRSCGGAVRRLDVVDRLAVAGRLQDVTVRDFDTMKREHDGWANE